MAQSTKKDYQNHLYLKHQFLFIISYVANLADDFILTLNSKPH